MIKKLLVALALIVTGNLCVAQDEAQVDSISMLGIPKYEQMYKVKVWRTINLNEKQNKGFFAKNNEITKLILKAVAAGEITNFYQADLTTKIPKDVFLKGMVAEEGKVFEPWVPTQGYDKDQEVSYNGVNFVAADDAPAVSPAKSQKYWKRAAKGKTPYSPWSPDKAYTASEKVVFDGVNYEAIQAVPVMSPAGNKEFWAGTNKGKPVPVEATDIAKLTLVENVIFDKRRSRLYYDILAIELFYWKYNPGIDKSAERGLSTNGSYNSLGWIWYKDLEKVFRAPEHVKEAVWFNRYNMAEKRNYADAFLLRLFHSTLERVENPDNETIFEVYQANGRGYKEAVFATEWEEMRLMEKEHNLWEY